jgi:hypothetical protein
VVIDLAARQPVIIPREHIDTQRHIDKPDPGRDIGEIDYPQLVRPLRGELPLHQILRAVDRRL